MPRILIGRDPFEPEGYEIHEEVEWVTDFLEEQFPEGWPDTARIYLNEVAQDHDITPSDDATIARLNDFGPDDTLIVVVYPAGFAAIVIAIVVAVVVAAVVAAVVLLAPQVPDVTQDAAARNTQNSSANNELSARSNKPRPNGRIPDIYGIVRSTPELLSQPYKVFDNGQELEVSYMCIGRGYYDVWDVRDGDTALAAIAGNSCAVYPPYTSPNSGTPQMRIGAPIVDPLLNSYRMNEVNGQVLRPPNNGSVTTPCRFIYPDTIQNGVGTNFADRFHPGDAISVRGAQFSVVGQAFSRTINGRFLPGGVLEFTTGNPTWDFVVGDSVVISGATITSTLDPYDVVDSNPKKFRKSQGRIYLQSGDWSAFRTSDTLVLSNADFAYTLDGSYTVQSVSGSTITLTNPSNVNNAWNQIPTDTGFLSGVSANKQGSSTDIVNGANAKFTSSGTIVLQTGVWTGISAGDTLVVTGSVKNFNLNGSYAISSINNSFQYVALNSPASVNSGWNEIPSSDTGYINATVTAHRATDTRTDTFDGTYTITGLTSTSIVFAGTSGPWNNLTDLVNNRSAYDTMYLGVNAPARTLYLDGTYTVVAVDNYNIALSNPAAVNPYWNHIDELSGNRTGDISCTLITSGTKYVGPFFIDDPESDRLFVNFYAPNGLYKDDGKAQQAFNIAVGIIYYPANSAGTVTGPAQTYTTTLVGSSTNKDAVGVTLKINPAGSGSCGYVYAYRITDADLTYEGSVVDEVKWRDCYSIKSVAFTQFGNVTTVHSQTYATGGALAVKERKLNMLVGRKIHLVSDASAKTFTPDLYTSTDAAQIFTAMALDPFFGNRKLEELDLLSIFLCRDAVNNYFGNTAATQFSYTFDNPSVSFEEAANAIANAMFCVAYRQGNIIKFKADIATSDSVMLFNHRNKIPDSESRMVRFGPDNDNDGIILDWVNPKDDAIESLYLPEDQSAVASKKINTIGIRNRTQAVWHAWRSFYKVKYQNVALEFEATQEAAILVQKDRILIADNTRADVQDGEVWDQDLLQLTLSQPVKFKPGLSYTIFLQHVDGTTEAIPITEVSKNVTIAATMKFLASGGIQFSTATKAGQFIVGDSVTLSSTNIAHQGTNLNFDGVYTVTSADLLTGIVMFDNPGTVKIAWTQIGPATETAIKTANASTSHISDRHVNLQYAPRLPLAMDPRNYAKTTYLIRGSDEAAPAVFILSEKKPKDGGTYTISAVNYDPRYFYQDDQEFWLNFDDGTFKDASAKGHAVDIGTAAGKAQISFDTQRGQNTFYNPSGGSSARILSSNLYGTTSYTKAAWVRQNGGFDCYFLSNSTEEQFRVNNAGRIYAGHAGNLTRVNSATWPASDGQWHHACATYDSTTQILRVYIDGVMKAQAVNVPPAPHTTPLQPIGIGNSGVVAPRCDDVRMWPRAFTPQEVMDLYNGTR